MTPFQTSQAQADSLMLEVSEKIDELSHMSVPDIFKTLSHDLINFGIKLLIAVIVYIVGAWIVKRMARGVRKVMIKRRVDPGVTTFTASLLSITLTILLIIVTISLLGINTTSFAALLAGGGVAIGMAMSGSLQNFAGGVMILFFKPFKVGEYIEAQGYEGTVKEINLTNTVIATGDNKLITLPNGNLSNGTVNNYSSSGTRRAEWNISISYGDDVAKAKEVFMNILSDDPRIIKEDPDMPLFVALANLGASDIVIRARAWCKTGDYWPLIFDINEKVYNEFPKNNIHFPYPQLDVNILSSDRVGIYR